MYLYHYTNKRHIEPIVREGMRFGSELDGMDYGYGTGPINGVLEQYKPKHLPAFMNRDACIFFHPTCLYRDFGNTEIKVDHAKLPKEKLFVADGKYAQQIWNDTVDASYSGETSGIPLSKSAKNYWDSIVLFEEYWDNPTRIREPEVLYFGKIPFEKLEVTTTLHPLAQPLFGHMKSKYSIKRWGSTYGQIYTSDNQYFTMEVHPIMPSFTLSSKTGHVNEQSLVFLEEKILFEEKSMRKNGTTLKIRYEGIQILP